MKYILSLFFLTLILTIGMFAYSVHYFTTPGMLAEEKAVVVAPGTGFKAIVEQLKAQKVIAYPYLFKAMVAINGAAGQFKAGEYHFDAHITPKQVMDKLADGDVVVHSITVPEGLTIFQIRQLLEDDTRLTGKFPEDVTEGSLLPDTYHIHRGDTRATVITRMQQAMDQALADAWATRQTGLPLRNKEEALIFASIIEKETGIDGERAHVASVFINRLNKGMRLQSDPTTIYGIEVESGPMERALTRKDLSKPTPYNTYTIPALPPTPIANPGVASLKAALNPLQTNDYYFVATGDGGHYFASTLKQHNANVARYKATLRAMKLR